LDDYSKYSTALNNNITAVTKFLNTLDLNELRGIKYWDGSEIEVSLNILGNKIYDILACTCIGALPKSESSGADGVLWTDAQSSPVEIETKLSGIQRHEIALGGENSLYYSTNLKNPQSKAALASKLSGAFHAEMSEFTLQSKARPTYLVVMDMTTNEFVDAWCLDGQTTLEQLQERRSNKNKTLKLKLQVFINHGVLVKSAVPTIGYINWQAILTAHAKRSGRFIKSVRREQREFNNLTVKQRAEYYKKILEERSTQTVNPVTI
jgi:hypothetical protein